MVSVIFCHIAIAIPIQEALNKHLLDIQVQGTEAGSINKSLKVQLKNTSTSAYTLEVPLGTIFEADNEIYQDMVTTEPLMVQLYPGVAVEKSLYAFCIQPNYLSPHPEVKFKFREIAKGKLMDIVKFVNAQKLFDGAGSALVWNVVRGSDVFYDCDVAEHNFKALKNYFSQHPKFQFKDCLDIPIDAQQYYTLDEEEPYVVPVVPTRPLITYTSVFELEFAKESDMEISLFDERGNVVKQFAKTKISRGHYNYKFEYTNSTLEENQPYEIRLIVDGIVRVKRTIKG